MKKILLFAAFAVCSYQSFAQAVIGTLNEQHLDFVTDDVTRGRWTSDGHLYINTTTAGFISTITLDSDPATVIEGDILHEAHSTYSHFVTQSSNQFRSGPYEYDGTLYDDGDFAYLLLHDGHNKFSGDGNTYLQAFIPGHGSSLGTARAIGLNPEGGPVLINYQTALNYDELQVDGSINTLGVKADIEVVTTGGSFVADNENYTIIGDVTSVSSNITVNLPSSSYVNDGKILVIKKVDYSDPGPSAYNVILNGSGSDTIDGNSTVTISTANEALTIQKKGTNWYIIGKY